MTAEKQAHQADPTGRVVLFPPRISLRKEEHPRLSEAKSIIESETAIGDLAKYERVGDADDYPRRMIINVVAFGFIVMLTVAGVWLAETMALLRKNQDCVFSGRRNCIDIGVEARDR